MIVVDTNIICYFYLSSEHSAQAERAIKKEPLWAAPILWRSEFRNVLSLYLRKEILSLADALRIMQRAESLMKGREYQVASAAVFRLAQSSGHPTYDCEFVALAQELNVQLVTANKKLSELFPDTAVLLDEFIKN